MMLARQGMGGTLTASQSNPGAAVTEVLVTTGAALG